MAPNPPASPSSTSPTLEHFVPRYVTHRVQRGRFTGQTPKLVRSVLYRFTECVGPDLPARSLKRAHIERWVSSRDDIAISTLRQNISVVRSFCHWLAAENHIPADPSRGVESPRSPRSVPRGLAKSKVSSVFAVLPDPRAELIVSLMVQEGLRCMGVASIQLGDVDFDSSSLFVKEKGGHERILPISAETLACIDNYLRVHPATAGPLIRQYDRHDSSISINRPLKPGTISKMVSSWMDAAGIKTHPRDGISAHALRHTALTDMLKAGAHLIDVQAAAGHASLETTRRYLPHQLTDLRKAMGGRHYRPEAEAETDTDTQPVDHHQPPDPRIGGGHSDAA